MYRILFVILMIFTNITGSFASDYKHVDLGVQMLVPEGAKVIEGNKLKPFSEEEALAFQKVFEADPSAIQQALNQVIFTIGYYDGPVSEGPNGSIIVSAIPAISVKNNLEAFSTALCNAEETETEAMSFLFSEKGTRTEISGHEFFVSKGDLKIIQNDVPIFEMPIYYYIAEINSKFVTFTVSGDATRVANLEKSLLSMVINEKL